MTGREPPAISCTHAIGQQQYEEFSPAVGLQQGRGRQVSGGAWWQPDDSHRGNGGRAFLRDRAVEWEWVSAWLSAWLSCGCWRLARISSQADLNHQMQEEDHVKPRSAATALGLQMFQGHDRLATGILAR